MKQQRYQLGKYRSLQQLSNENGKFMIVAIDHRESLWNYVKIGAGTEDPHRSMVAAKMKVISELGGLASGLLLDPVYSAGQSIIRNILPNSTGLLVSLESEDYTDGVKAGSTRILDGWSVSKIKRMGASAVKFFMYYHPDANIAHEQENVVARIAEECRREDIAFLLETMTYSIDPHVAENSGSFQEQKAELIARSAERLCPLGVDIFKSEFPGKLDDHNEMVLLEKSKQIVEAAKVPWVVLSAGVGFDMFARQVEIASRAGGTGFAVGRSVWKELVHDDNQFNRELAVQRFKILEDIVNLYAKPWYKNTNIDNMELANDWYVYY